MRHTAAALLAFGAAVLSTRAAHAACTVSVSPLLFGHYDVFDPAPLETRGHLVWECSSPVDHVRIRLARGTGSSARAHALSNGGNQLVYQVFLDPEMTRVWGDETEGTSALYVDTPSAAKSTTVPIFARILPRQNVKAGAYSDTLTVVIDF